MAHSITTLTAGAETALVVDVFTDEDSMQVGASPRKLMVTIRQASFHWSSDLPLGLVLVEPQHLLHVPGQLGAGNSYLIGTDRRGLPATP